MLAESISINERPFGANSVEGSIRPHFPRGDSDLPPTGMPLGLRLGATLAIAVSIVLGVLTSVQWQRETTREREDRERLMVEALAPLASAIEAAQSRDEIRELLRSYQQPFIERGYLHHQLELRENDGCIVATTLGLGDRDLTADGLHGFEEIRSPLFGDGNVQLHVWQDSSDFTADVRRRWRDRWIKILMAALSIIVLAQTAIYLLVSRPLGNLVRSLGKLEKGYVASIRSPSAAWEIRVLEWQLRRTTESLQDTVRRLVEAERRALHQPRQEPESPTIQVKTEDEIACRRLTRHDRLLEQYLGDLHMLMETSPPGDSASALVAAEVWERWAFEAERIGAQDLKIQLEDTALMILHGEAFSDLSARIKGLVGTRREWVDRRAQRIEACLAEEQIPTLAMQHRIKHVAGVWRKMQEKDLELEEVADLFAFRVIVAEEADCYAALGALHRIFEPHPFRFKDYIARPKANGYRSIHTSVQDDENLVFEIQIRDARMHESAESGASAHWTYKASCPAVPGKRRWRLRFWPAPRSSAR